MIKKKLLVLRLALFLGIFCISFFTKGNISNALTVTEVERLTRSALNDYLQANNLTEFSYSLLVGDLAAVNGLINQNIWTQKIPDIPFEDYNSFTWFVWTTYSGTNRRQIHVILQLFNDLDFTISAGNGHFNNIPINLINCTTDNQDTVASYRFITGFENETFTFDNNLNGSLTTTLNRRNYNVILYTTGEIYNVQNLLYFGGQLNRYTPLEFDQDPLEIVSLNGDLARYIQRRHL